ncbi:TIGR03773 family transporter-associated surface protein, partial [Corynebacterium sp.]|uniref:TIGR03773 family transporter-associated surface protein n=1 Tax=Corynebacterium sp. TaxID=1720 RepID=UPI002A9118A9
SSTATGKRDGKACVAGITPMIKDDRNVPAVWTSPADLSFHLGDAARTTLPESVGPVPAGTAWMIGATQQDNVPWLGANTQHPSMLDNQIGDVTWELVSFEGPGPVVVYTQGGLGQIMGEEWFRGADGRAQGSHDIAPNTHVHPVWIFGAPGTYKLGIRQSTTHNGAVFSGTDVLTFHVGEDGGNAREGHFDLGGVFNPDGGDCDTAGSNSASAKGGSGAQGTSGASGAGGKLAETGSNVMTLPFTVLGLGLVVFGIGVAYFTAALRKVTR